MGLHEKQTNGINGKRRSSSSSPSSSSSSANSFSIPKPSLFHLTMLTSIVTAAVLTTSTAHAANAPAQDGILIEEQQRPSALPYCNDAEVDRTIGRRLLYVSTLDGRLSALDISKGGKLRWSIPTGPGPLLSSSIHRLELTNNGQFVRMIPSLSGGIYKFDGEYVDPIPITTDNLLSSSAKFSDDLVISGGKETRTYGVSARTGQLLYECSMHGCVNITDVANSTSMAVSRGDETHARPDISPDYEHDVLKDDVLMVRRQTQTVRAVDTRSGVERWNFSVGQHELNLIKPAECHEQEFSEMDMAILDLDVKVVVPEGVICAFSKADPSLMLWKYKFDHPIVSSWKIGANDELEPIDIFSSAQWLWEDDEKLFETPFPSVSPTIYLGMYERQLYIQESVTLRNEILDQSSLQSHLTRPIETKLPKIPWRPMAASSNSLVLFQEYAAVTSGGPPHTASGPHLSLGVEAHELVPYNEDHFAVSAQSVLNGSEYVNGNGFYLYAHEEFQKPHNKSGQLCETQNNLAAIEEAPLGGDNATNQTLNGEVHFELDDIDAPVKVVILSLWFWWKEIAVIVFTSAVLLNLLCGHRRHMQREIVVIERHIPVPTAIEATEASTVALLGPVNNTSSTPKTLANGYAGRTLRSISESTSHSGEHFSSRFQDDFDLVRCLGRGGFGVVFETKNKLDDCKYAVKRITLPNKKESRDRVMREVKTLANCEHQNIVRYFQAWVETPPPGWQEEEDRKLLVHEMSTSIQIETPDGSSLPSFASDMHRQTYHLQAEKKRQLISWVSSVASTACSSDYNFNGLNGVKEEEDDDDDDSCIVFRTESESLAMREDEDDESKSKEKSSTKSQKSSNKTPRPDSVSIDIHSNSFDMNLSANGKHLNHSQLSDSFQIEFVRSANGAEQEEEEESQKQKKSKSNRAELSLDLHQEFDNNMNNHCKALLPVAQVTPPLTATTKPLQNKVYLYIQMQLCRKESLRDWLRENKREAREPHIGSIFYQIVDAVEYVHDKNLIHRDLKPSNIFFSQDGRIKIGDFGLVTDMSDIPNLITKCSDTTGLPSCARHTQQVGTHLYMSPEQLRGEHYDYKVDIYSLGLIFFELLVYFGTEMERINTLRDLRTGRYPKQFPDDYTAEHALLEKMLCVRPKERPSTEELKRQLSNILILPDVVGDGEGATLAAAVRRFSRSRTFSSAD